jgi:hypothetical protein
MEHNIIKFVRVNQKMVRKECEIVDLELEVYIGKLKVHMLMKCFDGWN